MPPRKKKNVPSTESAGPTPVQRMEERDRVAALAVYSLDHYFDAKRIRPAHRAAMRVYASKRNGHGMKSAPQWDDFFSSY